MIEKIVYEWGFTLDSWVPKVPQSSLGILRVPQLPPPVEHFPLKNPRIN